MTFPLPQGVCRKVCRPTRNPPRIIRASEVFRIARAEKRNGEGPCTILSSAYRAVPELDYPAKLTAAADALDQAYAEVFEAAGTVAKDLFTIRGGRMILWWRILTLILDVTLLINAVNDLSAKNAALTELARQVADCLE